MGEYILNEKYENQSVEEIFKELLDFCKSKPKYATLSGNKKHQIKEISNDRIFVERLEANNIPILTFGEIKSVIKLFKDDKIINTSNSEYRSLLTKVVNKTPLLSLLKTANIIVDY